MSTPATRIRLLRWTVQAALLWALNSPIATLPQQALQPVQTNSDQPPSPSSTNKALPAIVPANRPVIGLALEGGGALGLAHVGVLQWMEEHRIPVDRLAGTSMGSLVGALYATGTTPAEMRTLALSDAFLRVFTLQTSYVESSFRRRQDQREMPQALNIGLKHGATLRNALLVDRGVADFLATNLLTYNRNDLDYNRTPIPFRCVATDLTTLQAITFDHGPMSTAVRASISIPGVFSPARDSSGHFLVDGGIVDNLPTDVLKRDLAAEVIIAIHLEDAPLAPNDTTSIVGVLDRAFSAGIAHNVRDAEKLANVLVTVPVGQYSGTDYAKAAQLIDAGYRAAERSRNALLPYALSAEDWNAYLAARASRRLPTPGTLLQVQVEGGDVPARRQVQSDLRPLEGHPLAPAAMERGLANIQSNESYAATYTTFAPPPTGSPEPSVDSRASTPQLGVQVHLTPNPIGPPFLLAGLNAAASTSNIAHITADLRLVDQNLGGFGSELRTSVRLGYLTDIGTEYYRQLTPNGYFLQPSARVVRQPVYIWVNQKRVAEHAQQDLGTGIQAGRTFSNHLQAFVEWNAVETHWSPISGTTGGPYLNGTSQTAQLRLVLDNAVSGTVSPQGYRLTVSVGALYDAMGSDTAPVVRFSLSRTRQWNQKNIFATSVDLDSYFKTRVAQPFLFTLGGPLRLSASSFDEYRGTDTLLTRVGYLRRLAALPTGMGQGLYGVFSYESGEIWGPDQRAIWRQNGTFGLLGSTPLGAITAGASVGDAGRRKVFITLGRLF